MDAGIILLNFGEPAEPTLETVVPFLERIFLLNASLEDEGDEEAARRRSRELAERRAPSLLEEYENIGGSPLNRQAVGQARALESELRDRGFEVATYVGMQFTDPGIPEAVARTKKDGVERLVGLPVYPLCGPSTTVAALRELAEAVEEADWDVPLSEISGWHRHPDYLRLRADAIVRFAREKGVVLHDPGTRLLFSVHGTPVKYLREGSRYEEYARECCEEVAARAGVSDYVMGYQNHTNRAVEWTQPDVEDVIESLEADRVVVDAISFMHEQSETLAELDGELREEAEARGLSFHRVPVPHDDPRFIGVLADLVEPAITGIDPVDFPWERCRCRSTPNTRCLNGTPGGAPTG